jgi:hypothetical protein
MHVISRILMCPLVLCVLTTPSYGEYVGNVDKGNTNQNGFVPITFRLTGGSDSQNHRVRARKIIGYGSQGIQYGTEHWHDLAHRHRQVRTNENQQNEDPVYTTVYTHDDVTVTDIYTPTPSNSHDWRAWFFKELPNPTQGTTLLEVDQEPFRP